jgi:hypothetical protein
MRESRIEAAANRLAKKLGFWERKFKTPARRSAPDRIYAKNGRVFWIEFKRKGEKPTELQRGEHERMRAAGLTVYVCDCKEEYEAIFDYENRVAGAGAL